MRFALLVVAAMLGLSGLAVAQIATTPSPGSLNTTVSLPPPNGSYKQTCQDISFTNGVLSATCRTRAGEMFRSIAPLPIEHCAPGADISNLDGVVHCPATPGTYGFLYAMPPGDYWQTCNARETFVVAQPGAHHMNYICTNRAGHNVSGGLDMRTCDMRFGIVNDNGDLVCGSDPRRSFRRAGRRISP